MERAETQSVGPYAGRRWWLTAADGSRVHARAVVAGDELFTLMAAPGSDSEPLSGAVDSFLASLQLPPRAHSTPSPEEGR